MGKTNSLQIIENKIHEIRGVKVMLDFDLAEMYGMETRYLKRAVRNNLARFPSDFMFELSKEEFEALRCNFSTSNQRGGTRYMPFAFSEQGVAMLSSVLNSETAIKVNIRIIRAFVSMRQLILNSPEDIIIQRLNKLEENLNDMLAVQNDINEDTRMQIELVNEAIAELQVRRTTPRNPIGYAAILERENNN